MTCPLPRYWLCHMAVAALIMLALWPLLGLTTGAVAGAGFYIVRECWQRWTLGYWDWPGLLAPIASNAALWAAFSLLA